MVVVFERAPPPLTDQVTPAEFLSFVTAAVRATESVASTVAVDGVTATLADWMLPQPDRKDPKTSKRLTRTKLFRDIQSSGAGQCYAEDQRRLALSVSPYTVGAMSGF